MIRITRFQLSFSGIKEGLEKYRYKLTNHLDNQRCSLPLRDAHGREACTNESIWTIFM